MIPVGVPFVKGHGTENDFVLLPDLDDSLSLTPARVSALCDRRAGIGADGVIRIVRAERDVAFFMDYRNADGSVAEMCGNGARLFARYLVDTGLERPGSFRFGTAGGIRSAAVAGNGDVTVQMGPVVVGAGSAARVAEAVIPGIVVDVGNPHLVCLLDPGALDRLANLDLAQSPGFDQSLFSSGVNVEFVVPVAPARIRMRVFERGVGETRSCGTGTVAAAAAYLAGTDSDRTQVTVEVPGGSLTVDISAGSASLTGGAVIVASGTIDQRFWQLHP